MFGRNSASAKGRLTVLFDAWPLARAPGSPHALHLQELLALLPPDVDPLLAIPAALPQPAPARTLLWAAADSGMGRLAWEQVILPQLARRCGACLLHTTSLSAPLFCSVPVVLSPAEAFPRGFSSGQEQRRGIGWRLRSALGRGGLDAAQAVLWPADLPAPPLPMAAVRRMPPAVHPAFWMEPAVVQPEERGYVAAFGCFDNEGGLTDLLETWRWAAPAMGEDWTLRLAALPAGDGARLEQMRAAFHLPGRIQPAPLAGPLEAAALLAGAGAVLRLGPLSAWGDPLLHALAAGRPLASEEAWGVDARVGPAAYLAPSGDWRTLGAAVLTLLVEENVAEQVSQAARIRAAGWGSLSFSDQLREVYHAVRDQRRMKAT